MKRGIAVALLATMLLVAMVAPAAATKPDTGTDLVDGHKVTICHATSSVSNPYVEITIDVAAWNDPDDDKNHGDHHTRTKDGVTWKDYILLDGQECAIALTCADPDAITILFDGDKLVGPHPNPLAVNQFEDGTSSVIVPAGVYDVLLGSSDTRKDNTEQQDNERWLANFDNGATTFSTGYSDDLPDEDSDLTPFVETNVGPYFFSAGTFTVEAEHWSVANPPPGETLAPNSVIPEYVCLLPHIGNGDTGSDL